MIEKDMLKVITDGDNTTLQFSYSEYDEEARQLLKLLDPSIDENEKYMILGLLGQRIKLSAYGNIGSPTNNQSFQIMVGRMIEMNKEIEKELMSIKEIIKHVPYSYRKEICVMIKSFPKDPWRIFTISHILELTGISRNSYYKYIGNNHYGLTAIEKDALDESDVRKTFDYKGYPKGVRQVYMLIPKVCGRKIGLDRVRRIMRKYGMICNVRQPNVHKRSAADKMEKRRKDNLLKRMFRLHRPNEVRLTDVTVIECSCGLKAYGSALIDPVTNVVVAFEVSENNNLALARQTLRKADKHPCQDGGIFHSDQGIVYLTPGFQREVEALGFKQSMSKRGNCWDNAPQESFFGHFKDECRSKYEVCENIEELRKVIDDYVFYYNNERGQWDRNHMTPLEYESYLLSLSDEEFSAYMEKETKKYEKMKEEAKQKAIERYKTLGV